MSSVSLYNIEDARNWKTIINQFDDQGNLSSGFLYIHPYSQELRVYRSAREAFSEHFQPINKTKFLNTCINCIKKDDPRFDNAEKKR